MDGPPQRAGQAQRFVQAQFDFCSHQACEIERIFLEAIMRELDLIEQRSEIAGPGQRLQPGKIAVNSDHQFGMGKYLRVGYGSDVEFTMKGMERVDTVLRRLAA